MRRDIDDAVRGASARQSGVVSRNQIYAFGGDRWWIDRRVASGALLARSENVLVVPSHNGSFRQRLWAAVLDSEEGACVSHESAARLYRFDTFEQERRALLTVPHGDNRSALADRVHQTRYPPQINVVDGLPITTVARTVVDLGRKLRAGRLEAIVDDVLRRRLVRTSDLRDEWLECHFRWPWRLRVLGEILASRGPGYRPPRSDLERTFRELLAGMPGITFEAPFPGIELPESCVDALAMPERVILEFDGRDWHTRRQDFVRDRERDRAASRVGYLTVRYTHDDAVNDRDGVRAEIDEIRARRRRDLGLAA